MINSFNEIRNMSRQNEELKELDENKIEQALLDFQSGQDLLQLHSLKLFLTLLDSEFSDKVVKKYGSEAVIFFIDLCQYGMTPEIQNYAILCLALCYRNHNLSISAIKRPQFIEFLVQNKLFNNVQEANAALSLLSIIASESKEKIQILIDNNIFQALSNMPPECNYGELVDVILQQILEPSPVVEIIASFIPVLLQSPNPKNVCHGLQCVGIFITRGWNCFDYDGFHSSFPQFLSNENTEILSTAFSVLEKMQPSNEDLNAVLKVINRGGNNAYFPIQYLQKTLPLWKDSPPPQLIQCLVECISNSKYRIINQAMDLLSPALSASGIVITNKIIHQLLNFLQDKNLSSKILEGLLIIWDRIQATDQSQYFVNEISQYDSEIEDLLSSSNEKVANYAQKLLEIMC